MTITSHVRRWMLPVLAVVGVAAGSPTGTADATPTVDRPRLAGVDLDFGDGGLSPVGAKDPMLPGLLRWEVDGSTVRPHLVGDLYLNDALGMHARVRLRYFDVFGNLLEIVWSNEQFAPSNATHTFPIDIDSFADPTIYRVEVATEYRLGSNWAVRKASSYYI